MAPMRSQRSLPEVARFEGAKEERLAAAVESVWLAEGDLGLTVRRLAVASDTTSQTLYTYWGSRDALLAAVADALTAVVVSWGLLSDGQQWLAAGLDRPAAWRMMVLGRGPDGHGAHNTGLRVARDQALAVVGGEVGLAQLDGLIVAVQDGRLDRGLALAIGPNLRGQKVTVVGLRAE